MLVRLLKSKKGAALVEYGLLIAGVALVSAAAVSIFGHKTNDLIAGIASVLPGAHADDNGPINSGRLLETVAEEDTDGDGINEIRLDTIGIQNNSDTKRLRNNLGIPIEALIIEPEAAP